MFNPSLNNDLHTNLSTSNINDNTIDLYLPNAYMINRQMTVFSNSNLQHQHPVFDYISCFSPHHIFTAKVLTFSLGFFFVHFIHNVPAQLIPPASKHFFFLCIHSAIHQLIQLTFSHPFYVCEQLQKFKKKKIFWVDRSMNLFIPFPLITISNYIFP